MTILSSEVISTIIASVVTLIALLYRFLTSGYKRELKFLHKRIGALEGKMGDLETNNKDFTAFMKKSLSELRAEQKSFMESVDKKFAERAKNDIKRDASINQLIGAHSMSTRRAGK